MIYVINCTLYKIISLTPEKVVNDAVQSSVAERLASDETLKNMIQGTLLPSFQQQLDFVYRGFTDTLQKELQHNSLAASQVRDIDII